MNKMKDKIKQNTLIRANFFPEDIKVLVANSIGSSYKIVGQGMKTGQTHSRILTETQIGQIEIISKTSAHVEGEATRFRLGIEAMRMVSKIDDAKQSLPRSRWDLIIVDEAHKMSASDCEHQTLAYQFIMDPKSIIFYS
jgi:hypothetical protein